MVGIKNTMKVSFNFRYRKKKLITENAYEDHLRNISGQNSRFPRIEEMSHFHYSNVDFGGTVTISLNIDQSTQLSSFGSWQIFAVEVVSKESWTLKRSYDDFVGLDRQLHRCLYDRRYSKLPPLKELEDGESASFEMVQLLQTYVRRFSDVSGNNINCGPVLNWLELDNHGNHLVVMEADDSAINVPAIAAGRVIKRYQAQAPDEMTLDVGEFLSIIDMPHVEETIWWRGKKGFEVGFFPSNCIEVLGEKDVNDKIISRLQSRPLIKRRGKLVSFLRFFFKSRPSKDELMQHGILRERVFGCDLGEYLALTGHDIPIVLKMCSDVIEEHGIVDGIYRLSGITSNILKLRVAFDSEEEPPNLNDSKFLNDIHCISSLLKTYFRELPNPLFTYELYAKFVAAINKEDDTEKTVAFHHVIQRLPPPHYRTMHYLFRHLNFCAEHCKETNMTAKNLAIVWAPNLLRLNIDDSVAALAEFRTQAIIVEYMIRNVDVFFDKNMASAAIAYYPETEEQDQPEEPRKSISGSVSRIFQANAVAKLISLEEARERVRTVNVRKPSYSPSTGSCSSSNSTFLKFHSTVQPRSVAASPISPLPTLLSLEEAQARSKAVFLTNQRSSADVTALQTANITMSPKRSRKWLGLFSRAKSASPNQSVEKVKHPTVYKLISSPQRSLSEIDIHNLRKKQIEHPSLQHTASVDNLQKKEKVPDVKQRQRASLQSISVDHSPVNDLVEGDFCSKESDGDDSSIMSAIEIVSKKYLGVSSSELIANRNIPKTPFNKHDLSENSSVFDSKVSESKVRLFKSVSVRSEDNVLEKNKYTNTLDVALQDKNDQRVSPERKHRSFTNTNDDDLPIKKTRSLSPGENKLLIKNGSSKRGSLESSSVPSDWIDGEIKTNHLNDRPSSRDSSSYRENKSPLRTMSSLFYQHSVHEDSSIELSEHFQPTVELSCSTKPKTFGSVFQLVASPRSSATDVSTSNGVSAQYGNEKMQQNLALSHPPNVSVIHPLLASRKSSSANKSRSNSLHSSKTSLNDLPEKKPETHIPKTPTPTNADQSFQSLNSSVQRTTDGIMNSDLRSLKMISLDSQSYITKKYELSKKPLTNVDEKPMTHLNNQLSLGVYRPLIESSDSSQKEHSVNKQSVLVRSTEERMKQNNINNRQDPLNSITLVQARYIDNNQNQSNPENFNSVSRPTESSKSTLTNGPSSLTNKLGQARSAYVKELTNEINKISTGAPNDVRDSLLKTKSLSSADVTQYSHNFNTKSYQKFPISDPLKNESKGGKDKRHSSYDLDTTDYGPAHRTFSLIQQSKNVEENDRKLSRGSLTSTDSRLKNNSETSVLLSMNSDLRSTSSRSQSPENSNYSNFITPVTYPLKSFSKEHSSNPVQRNFRDSKMITNTSVYNKRPSSEYIASNNAHLTSFRTPLKSLSTRQLFDNDTGQRIGNFQLTLKDGSSRRSRPLSMHDKIDHMHHDSLQQMKYEMV